MDKRRIASLNQINLANQFVDSDVEYEIRAFHHYCFSQAQSPLQDYLAVSLVTADDLKEMELAETRFSHITQLLCPREISIPHEILRWKSLQNGRITIVDFKTIAEIFGRALGADDVLRRPYPSGGALYSVEAVLICGKMVAGLSKPAAIMHYLPVSRAFEILGEKFPEQDFASITDIANPAFYVLYCINLKKAIFKYRSRGYRLSLMEVGSMYQNMSMAAQDLGLSSRLISGFQEYHLAQLCNIDYRLMLPAVLHVFGVEHENNRSSY